MIRSTTESSGDSENPVYEEDNHQSAEEENTKYVCHYCILVNRNSKFLKNISYSNQFSRATAAVVAATKSPGLLDEIQNSLQGVMGKIHGINLGDNTILRLHSKNYIFTIPILSSFTSYCFQ